MTAFFQSSPSSDITSSTEQSERRSSSSSSFREYYDHQTKDSMTALHCFCKSGRHHEEVKDMIQIYPQLVIHPTAIGGDTPLHFSVAAHDMQTTSLLLQTNPSAVEIQSTQQGYFGSRVTPLHVALTTGATPKMISALVSAAPKSLKMRDGDGRTPLQVAAMAAYSDQMRVEILACLQQSTTARRN